MCVMDGGVSYQKTNFVAGSCDVEFANEQDAVSCVERCATAPARVGKKNLKVNYAPARAKDSTKAGQAGERPPVPITPGA